MLKLLVDILENVCYIVSGFFVTVMGLCLLGAGIFGFDFHFKIKWPWG